jgi:glycosyltransferase involved in cell wall biosynthesis
VVRRIALVTHGFTVGGGVPAVTRWLKRSLETTGAYAVDIYDLATSSRDRTSRRLASPRSWARSSLRSGEHWGANAVELEFMRYRPRRELTQALRAYDLIQVVAGTPAWAVAVLDVDVPVVLQVATLASWERQAQLSDQALPARAWRRAMTAVTTRFERRALREATAVLVENDAMLRHAAATGQPRVRKAPPGVDTAFFTPNPAGWNRDGHILSVSRLGDARKGLDRTIRAYAAIVRRRNTAPPLVLAGKGTLSAQNWALIEELGLTSRVIVRRDVASTDLLALYQHASVFVQTSHEEGLGLSVLEAMSCALPVVATRTAGSSETVEDAVTGWVVPQTRPELVADRTIALLENGGNEFGRAGRLRCNTLFSSTASLQAFIRTHDEVLQTRPRIASAASR